MLDVRASDTPVGPCTDAVEITFPNRSGTVNSVDEHCYAGTPQLQLAESDMFAGGYYDMRTDLGVPRYYTFTAPFVSSSTTAELDALWYTVADGRPRPPRRTRPPHRVTSTDVATVMLALWATPRTVSTAFERMMIERGDHLVLDEPWSRAYYFGPERVSDRFGLTFPESTFAAVETGVLDAGAGGAPVFVKDMAYHAAPGISDGALRSMTHTFLIRDPLAALSSLHRRWPDFTDDEAGYTAQRALFDRVVAVTDSVPAVVDSDALVADPDRVVAAWCERVGIDHRPASLHWSTGMRPEWQLWRDWYENAAASTGFDASNNSRPDDDPPQRVRDLVAAAEHAVAPLRAHALQ